MMISGNIPFRGSSNKLSTGNNGNFFIIEFFSKFDRMLEKHIKLATENPHKTYLGKYVQQEVVSLIM